MTDHEMDPRIRELLAEAYPPGELQFDAGFADRVMARAAGDIPRSSDLDAALTRQCRRVLPVLVAASAALVIWNWSTTRDSSDSVISAALGLSSAAASTTELTSMQGAEAFQ